MFLRRYGVSFYLVVKYSMSSSASCVVDPETKTIFGLVGTGSKKIFRI